MLPIYTPYKHTLIRGGLSTAYYRVKVMFDMRIPNYHHKIIRNKKGKPSGLPLISYIIGY